MEPLKSVLIADDDACVVTLLKAFLNKYHYALTGVAINGVEAVQKVQAQKPNLILLDVHMPLLDGLEATKQIALQGTTAVVILTGDPDPVLARQAMDFGACGYMLKPLDIGQLGPIMESAWHRFQTVLELQAQTRSLTEALELRKLLEKAKGILMEQQGYAEDEAHRVILKMSQDQGISVKELCRSLIQVRMVLGNKAKSSANRKAA